MSEPFKHRFAPHPKLLPGAPEDYLDELRYALDHGFRAWEDNYLGKQEPGLQERVGDFAREQGLALGVSVISNGQGIVFAQADADAHALLKADMQAGIELSKRTGQRSMTMIAGQLAEGLDFEAQLEGAAETLRRCCEVVEAAGLILALEPLSHDTHWGKPLVRTFAEGHALCKRVNHPSCKLLADFYHEGAIGNDPLESAQACWDEATYVQIGDHPGRCEPGSGSLDYPAILSWLDAQGYVGPIGMEHGTSQEGEAGLKTLLAAYRDLDARS